MLNLDASGVTELDETELRSVEGGARVHIPIGGADPIDPEPEPLI